jgi:hypothetical protein
MEPLPISGRYTILISDSGLDETGIYTLNVERVLPERRVKQLDYNTTENVGINYTTDHDWLEFYAEQGSIVSLAVNSPNAMDPILDVYDPNGDFLVSASCGYVCSLPLTLPDQTPCFYYTENTVIYTVVFRDVGLDETGTIAVTLNCVFNPNGICANATPDVDLGSNYCMTNVNSTGEAASITAIGSASIADDRVFLRASDVPLTQFGIFFMGPNQAPAIPIIAPSQGLLCVGGPLGRLRVTTSCNAGEMEQRLDLGDLPLNFVIQSGESWNFQAWFRDGASSNTTDGLAITFQ